MVVKTNTHNEKVFYLIDKNSTEKKHIKVTIERLYLTSNFDKTDYLKAYGSVMWFSRYDEVLPKTVVAVDEI